MTFAEGPTIIFDPFTPVGKTPLQSSLGAIHIRHPQFFRILDPLPPLVMVTLTQPLSTILCFGPTTPLSADVIRECPLSFPYSQMPEVQFHSIAQKKLLYKFAAHEKRVR